MRRVHYYLLIQEPHVCVCERVWERMLGLLGATVDQLANLTRITLPRLFEGAQWNFYHS